jgi:hypothetical protein
MLRRLAAAATLFAAALALAGCFVVSKNVPAGQAGIDHRLIGTWRAIDADDNKDDDAFLTFQKYDDAKPLRLVWVEGRGYQIYDVITMKIANRDVFAATLTGPEEALKEKDMTAGRFIGFYDVSGDRMRFFLFDAEKIGKLIQDGKVKGTRAPGKWEMATLTGSPEELAAFLASPEALAARIDDPARLRRLTPPVQP